MCLSASRRRFRGRAIAVLPALLALGTLGPVKAQTPGSLSVAADVNPAAAIAPPPAKAVSASEPAPVPTAPAPVSVASPALAASSGTGTDYPTRIWSAFVNDCSQPAYSPPAANAPASSRRGQPTPFDSPPFPDGEWQLGGTPQLGDPNELAPDPLMEALYAGPDGKRWKDSRIQVYGWVDVGGNASTSNQTNAPAAYAVRPNQVELDQAVVYFERLPDEFQTDHIDWGFRGSALYGLDYRYTTMEGILSNQLLHQNAWYGLDFPMIYGDLYIPQVAQGMNLRFGRYISLPDIEAQLAPDNLMYTHSLLYTVDPYTQIGVMASVKLDARWTVQAGLSGGNDVALWVHGAHGSHPTLTAMAQWISRDNRDSLYFGVNSLNNGHYGYNNLQMFVNTWTHTFNPTVWTATEAYYMFERDVPASALPTGVTAGYAPEWGAVNYVMVRLAGRTFLSVRNEFLDDHKGQRTGYATTYSEHALGLTWWPNRLITVRPEIRYEHAYSVSAYDHGTKSSQFIFGGDAILHF
jgi:hypothetical protein